MANAAAKKAAAAKKEATKIYLPVVIIVNLIYVVLLLGGDALGTTFGILGALVTWAEQAYSYLGILEHAATHAASQKKSKDLAGGSSLDLLAMTILVQFGSVLHSTKWLWLTLVGVPIVGAYSLYKAVYGGSNDDKKKKKKNNNNNNSSGTKEPDENDPMTAKRQRRAEKRRQKWK